MIFSELLASMKGLFKSYDSVGLIEDISVYDWYLECLKEFGTLPFEMYEEVIQVKNGRASLPKGFRKLLLAAKCEPFTYSTKHKDHLQDARFWRERHEKTASWDSCDDCCVEESEKYIVEKMYYREYECDYYYKNPILLRLTEGVNKKMCTSDCTNLKVQSSPFEINIVKGNTLQANFKEGTIFLRYRGFEEDEEGFVEVPETFNGHLEKYVESYVKSKIMESIMANGDATTNEATLFQLYRQDSRDNKIKAMTELKAKNFGKEARTKYKNRLRLETAKFKLAF